MAAHAELAEIFGEENIEKMGYREALRTGLSEVDALILSHVGLPKSVGAIFTTQLKGSPPLFAVRNFDDNGDNRALIIGGPEDDHRMRYFLNVRDGFVGLIAFHDEPHGEVVNTTLGDFVEFIYRIAQRDISEQPGSGEEGLQEADMLAALLIDRDPHAFRNEDTWWSMAINRIREHEAGQA
ncbi:SUKH-4 family immunity protein [Streptomyces sp. TS71-3]|uniref:SUKH-4 family immunity protein n=1 Tax=Streptomyces sp. TS71-3 TaxID=2733862 RepID=UPI001B1F6DAA|nr:SUKH-4 family immunity protein [Streptomyces sp. TS71-3]GHJ35079.1 hypothetical protein Sm713_06880 [Streptomyces sp. TS71-3]